MIHTIGIDIGSGAVKTTLFRSDGAKVEWLARRVERIRRRDPMTLARSGHDEVLDETRLKPNDIAYVATTGEGENVKFATGHFYSMTTHARGGVFLNPEARAVVDIGARHLHRRARQGAVLQDDQPVRVGLRAVPGEHRALPRRRDRGDRPAFADFEDP
jgi:bcr-type benzoyl-CoA reductase subunit D